MGRGVAAAVPPPTVYTAVPMLAVIAAVPISLWAVAVAAAVPGDGGKNR